MTNNSSFNLFFNSSTNNVTHNICWNTNTWINYIIITIQSIFFTKWRGPVLGKNILDIFNRARDTSPWGKLVYVSIKNWMENYSRRVLDGSANVDNVRDTSKLLRIEMENYHIIMTMGMYRIEPPWVSICLIHTYQTKYRYWYA
jgi:hypothetical protein